MHCDFLVAAIFDVVSVKQESCCVSVCRHINEDKRRAEGHQTLFSSVNDIENCPVSHHAFYVLFFVV